MEEVLMALLPVLTGLGGAVTGLRFVREGERALMLRFDKAVKRRGTYKVVMPGLRIMVPGMHKLARIHVRQRTLNFPSQAIVLKDNTIFDVSAVLLCRVKDTPQDLYNALFETTGINGALTDYGLLVIREVLGDKSYQDLFGEGRQEIVAELLKKMQTQADEWGVEVIRFELSDIKPNDDTARLIQTSAQTTFRFNALKEAAQQLGYADVRKLPSGLAATLIGVPLVATTTVNVDPGYDDGEDE